MYTFIGVVLILLTIGNNSIQATENSTISTGSSTSPASNFTVGPTRKTSPASNFTTEKPDLSDASQLNESSAEGFSCLAGYELYCLENLCPDYANNLTMENCVCKDGYNFNENKTQCIPMNNNQTETTTEHTSTSRSTIPASSSTTENSNTRSSIQRNKRSPADSQCPGKLTCRKIIFPDHANSLAIANCVCKDGYHFNENKTQCIPVNATETATAYPLTVANCVCKDGYHFNENKTQCIPMEKKQEEKTESTTSPSTTPYQHPSTADFITTEKPLKEASFIYKNCFYTFYGELIIAIAIFALIFFLYLSNKGKI